MLLLLQWASISVEYDSKVLETGSLTEAKELVVILDNVKLLQLLVWGNQPCDGQAEVSNEESWRYPHVRWMAIYNQ